MSKRPLVLWSGGFDSTALLIELLIEEDVDILYVNLENSEELQRYEKKAITKLKCIIADANLKGKIINEHTFSYGNIVVNKTVYGQPALWINASADIANIKDHSSVNIAYVKYDDAWHYKTEIVNAYKAMNSLICDGDTVPLKFPYEWYTKKHILDRMETFVYYKQILNTVRYCEASQKKPCGECASCIRHKSELG